jgi:hypothetical protein
MKAFAVALFGAATLAMTAGAASAAVVCNSEGDCWHVRGRPHYEPGLRLRIYDDNWHWRRGEHFRWRKAGPRHGYWRNGVWVEIR